MSKAVGTFVRIKSWVGMERVFDLDEDGDILLDDTVFSKHMRKFCENLFVIKRSFIDRGRYQRYTLGHISGEFPDDLDNWVFTDDMFLNKKKRGIGKMGKKKENENKFNEELL